MINGGEGRLHHDRVDEALQFVGVFGRNLLMSGLNSRRGLFQIKRNGSKWRGKRKRLLPNRVRSYLERVIVVGRVMVDRSRNDGRGSFAAAVTTT